MHFDERKIGDYRVFTGALEGLQGDGYIAALIVQRFDLQRLTITRGGDGWVCLDSATGWLEGRSPAVTVRDTVGAGDAFASVLLLGELRAWPLRTTLQRAGAHASAACGIAGAVDPASGIYAAARAAWAVGA